MISTKLPPTQLPARSTVLHGCISCDTCSDALFEMVTALMMTSLGPDIAGTWHRLSHAHTRSLTDSNSISSMCVCGALLTVGPKNGIHETIKCIYNKFNIMCMRPMNFVQALHSTDTATWRLQL